MSKKVIVDVEVVMRDIAGTKETVKETIRYWQMILDELDSRAVEYEGIYKNMKKAEEEDKKIRNEVELNMKLNLRGRVFDTTKDMLLNNSTYFSLLLSSPSFELDLNGEFFIDRNSHCFNRILEYMSTGELSTEGLNSYDKDCLYDNLKYFMIPHKPRLDYSQISVIENLELEVLLQLKDGRLCGTAGYYRDIVVYNMDTNRIDSTLERHDYTNNAVIQLDDGRICSCSDDDTIKVWNIKSGQCELCIEEHTNDVNCVIQLLDGRLCSGSDDETLKVWSKDSGACELSVDTKECVKCIAQLRDGRVCTGDNYSDIKVWNLNTRLCEMTLNEPGYSITVMVAIDESRICSCSGDMTVKVWNIDTGACERTLVGHQMCVNHIVLLLDGRVCSASDDGILKIWNTGIGVWLIALSISMIAVVGLKEARSKGIPKD
jgi:WD40 repeat protein